MSTRKYFGTDGIRGLANRSPMTAEIAMKVAKATAYVLKQQSNGGMTNRVIIGKDTRLSGYMFEEAMCAGFLSMGMNVIMVGPIPTPGIALLSRSMRADIGVMISASHNKYLDNGIKLFGADGYKLGDDLEKKIEEAIDSNLEDHLAPPEKIGKAKRLDDALGRYTEHVKSSFPKEETLEGVKIVVDCAHGAAYKVAPEVLWELEASVIPIGVNPDGRNINAGYGATATENLQKKVIEESADIGIALDGDADRLIVVDEKGNIIDGDQILAALALDMSARGRLSMDTVVTTVMSNLGFEKALIDNGIRVERTAVGDRHVMECMKEGGFNLGGEQSGHIIMSNYGTTGDGLLAALRVLLLIRQSGKKTSEALQIFKPFPQVLKNVTVKDKSVIEKDAVTTAITDIENKMQNGRILVRPSGTESLIRVMVEGEKTDEINMIADNLCTLIANAAA